ncbi:iron(III) transport system permease protein [Azospirillum agricola]|uniref:ABC transporter permease n=1 Tax=Azospirillum agricola TaxID=1720247 RepID=UPI001AEB3982|nr:ABC transporter permease subunit [Azospirillum agricola]MBP2231922.1 iron(III) transport system permease protein [Azospirillum agricola]
MAPAPFHDDHHARSAWSWLRRRRRRLWPLPLFAGLALLLVWPAAMLAIGVFRTAPPGMPGGWSVEPLLALPGSTKLWSAAAHSVLLALLSTAVAVVAAAGFAFLAQRTDLRLRRLVTPTMVVIYATPSLFHGIGFSLLGNPAIGFANAALRAAFGPEAGLVNVESGPGLLAVIAIRATAFTYLLLAPAFLALDRAHEDASLVSGVGRFGTVLRIDLPLLTPALSGAAILAFVAGLHSFDIPLILGQAAGIEVLSTAIYDRLVHAYPPQYATASALSLLLVLVAAALSLLQARVLGRRSFVTVAGKATRQHRLRLGRWGLAGNAAILAFVLVAVIGPLLSLLLGSVQSVPGVLDSFTLVHYQRVFQRPGMIDAVRTTALLAVGVGALAMTLAVLLAQAGQALPVPARSALRLMTLIPFAMPGIVTALAVMWAYVGVPGLRQIYGTVWMLVLALVVVALPFAMQAAQAASAQIAPELTAAARVSGASAPRALLDVVGRLIAPSFLTGWFLVAIAVAGNLDVPLLLGTPTLGTVASHIYQLQTQGQLGDATALLVTTMAGLFAAGLSGLGALRLLAVKRRRPALGTPRVPRSSTLERQAA